MDMMEAMHHSSLGEHLGLPYCIHNVPNVLSQHMPVFGKALVRSEVVDRGSYVHLMEL